MARRIYKPGESIDNQYGLKLRVQVVGGDPDKTDMAYKTTRNKAVHGYWWAKYRYLIPGLPKATGTDLSSIESTKKTRTSGRNRCTGLKLTPR